MSRFCLSVVVLFPLAASAADWPAFRGSKGNGVSTDKGVPTTWDAEKNVLWKTPLPGPGNSSPIVSRGKVFVTCATDEGRKRTLFCLDRVSGKELWSKTVEYAKADPTHGTNPYSGSTPATDGERIVVFEGSAGLHCYDFEGNKLWERDLGEIKHIWGYGSSPVFHDGRIILNCGPGERTFVTAIDSNNGKTLWQTDEPGGASGEGEGQNWVGSWSTPQIATVNGRDQVLVSHPRHVNAYDPLHGQLLWTVDGLGPLVYTSVVLSDNAGVAMSGYGGAAIGFKLGGSGDVTESNRLWQHPPSNPQRIGSGIIIGGLLYHINEPGLAQCLDVQSGQERWKSRIPGGNVWGSPVLVDGLLFVTNQLGTTLVIRPDPEKFDLVAQNPLGEPSNSTPAVSDAQFFLRTFNHIWCIGEK